MNRRTFLGISAALALPAYGKAIEAPKKFAKIILVKLYTPICSSKLLEKPVYIWIGVYDANAQIHLSRICSSRMRGEFLHIETSDKTFFRVNLYSRLAMMFNEAFTQEIENDNYTIGIATKLQSDLFHKLRREYFWMQWPKPYIVDTPNFNICEFSPEL
jgi:hypothetical protein